MGLSMQYFVIYTLLANDQTGNQFATNAHFGMQKTLETACTIVTDAAMLNVFFLAALMHATKITRNKAKKHKMPQLWTQTAMFCCVNAVSTQVIIVLEVSTDDQENLDTSNVESGKSVATTLSAATTSPCSCSTAAPPMSSPPPS